MHCNMGQKIRNMGRLEYNSRSTTNRGCSSSGNKANDSSNMAFTLCFRMTFNVMSGMHISACTTRAKVDKWNLNAMINGMQKGKQSALAYCNLLWSLSSETIKPSGLVNVFGFYELSTYFAYQCRR